MELIYIMGVVFILALMVGIGQWCYNRGWRKGHLDLKEWTINNITRRNRG